MLLAIADQLRPSQASHAYTWQMQQEIVFPCAGEHAEPLPSRLDAEPAVLRTSPPALPLFTVAATLSRTDSGQRLSDQTVTFSARGVALCTAVTDAAGRARCSALGGALQILLGGGYTATFAGTRDVAPASAAGPILR